jgi:hypothetical protein
MLVIGMLSELLLGVIRNLLQEDAARVTRPLFGAKGIRLTPAIVFCRPSPRWPSSGEQLGDKVRAVSSRNETGKHAAGA